MKEMRLLAERDSVCMGDDCTAPNGKYIQYKRGIRLSELLLQIAGYVPDYSGRQHTIWGIEHKGVPIAFLECDEHNKYKCILAIDDIPADTLNEEKIYCRYFFDYRGNLSTNLKNVSHSDRFEVGTLLKCVKAYYDLPEGERWGWY